MLFLTEKYKTTDTFLVNILFHASIIFFFFNLTVCVCVICLLVCFFVFFFSECQHKLYQAVFFFLHLWTKYQIMFQQLSGIYALHTSLSVLQKLFCSDIQAACECVNRDTLISIHTLLSHQLSWRCPCVLNAVSDQQMYPKGSHSIVLIILL